jgi:hypothetical protein
MIGRMKFSPSFKDRFETESKASAQLEKKVSATETLSRKRLSVARKVRLHQKLPRGKTSRATVI